jgi:hypothetical protein
MEKAVLFFLSFMLFSTSAFASPPESIPNSKLRVTVQQVADGKIVNGFHVLELSCLDGNCSLSSISLNECGDAGSGIQAFNPEFQYASTSIGNLKARNEGKTIIVQETGSDLVGNYLKNMRFEYEPAGDFKTVTRLTGFSGGYTKKSVVLDRVFTLDYVPLPKASQVVKLDCGVILPGINKK